MYILIFSIHELVKDTRSCILIQFKARAKLYTPSTINDCKKLFSPIILAGKNGLVSCILACTYVHQVKPNVLNNVEIYILIHYILKSWKVKEITHNLNHDLIF